MDIRRRISAAWVVSLKATLLKRRCLPRIVSGTCGEWYDESCAGVWSRLHCWCQIRRFVWVSRAWIRWHRSLAIGWNFRWIRECVEESVLCGFSLGRFLFLLDTWLVRCLLLAMLALMLMRFCGSAPVCLCGFCPADAACRWLLIYFGVLPFLWFRNLCWAVAEHVHGLSLWCTFHHSWSISQGLQGAAAACRCNIVTAASHTAAGFSGAIAAFLVVAFVLLAAFAFVHSCHCVRSLWPCRRQLLSVWCRRDACRVAGRLVRLRALALCRAGDLLVCTVSADLDDLNLFYVIDGLCTFCQRLLVCRWCVQHLPKLRQLHLFSLHHAAASVRLWVSLSFLEVCHQLSTWCARLCSRRPLFSWCLQHLLWVAAAASVLGLLSSICSAFVGVLFVFEGVLGVCCEYRFESHFWRSVVLGPCRPTPKSKRQWLLRIFPKLPLFRCQASVTANIDEAACQGFWWARHRQ